MNRETIQHPLLRWLSCLIVLAFVAGSGVNVAVAQSEPTINQVYEAARAGRIDQANAMMKQVLAAHPNSAKAHFVHAELLAQQGRLDAARTSLARAEEIAPGLPFANRTAVDGLRARLSGGGLNGLSGVGPRTAGGAPATGRESGPTPSSSRTAPSSPASGPSPSSRSAPPSPSGGSSFGWFLPVLLIGGGVAVFLMMRRRRAATSAARAYPGGFSGPQSNPAPGSPGSYATNAGVPGTYATNAGAAGMPQPYGQPQAQPYGQPQGQPYQQGQPYGQPQPYGQQQPAGGGWGGRIAGGLATGAAIGAGMIAAQAIARNMGAGNDANKAAGSDAFNSGDGRDTSIPPGDLGGENFGVSGDSWDDSGSFSGGGVDGGSWDN